MLSFMYVEINVIALIISIVILYNQKRSFGTTQNQKLFFYLLISLNVMLVTDSGMWLLDGSTFPFARQLNLFATWWFYFSNCIVTFLWLQYTISFFNYQRKSFKKCRSIIYLPIVIQILCNLFNLKYGFLYQISQDNIYQRGDLFFLNVLLAYLYILAAFIISIINYRESEYSIRKQESKLMLTSLILPTIGSLIQMAYYGVSLVGICIAISMLIVFINFQNRQISTDSLTQLNNRYQFDNYLHTLASESSVAHTLIMIDIDTFKSINDTYGHNGGDRALIAVADLLRKSCHNTHSFLCRYGGDEFAIICENLYTDIILCRIQSEIDAINRSAEHPFPLSLSTGTAAFSSEQCSDFKQVVAQADGNMYQNKKVKCR